jgi:DNA-directed RNA polymerase subunit alpha
LGKGVEVLYDIHLPEIKTIEEKDNRATFAIEPLSPGYGMTLGNSLRRVILSSLPGAAVTAVKIDGVAHEFSNIPNIKEDVIEIILNLKQLRVKLHSDEEYISLSASGPGEVKAKDIKTNQNVEIVNGDLHIATLDGKQARLDMEIRVEKGRGYVQVEKRDGEKLGVGMIAIDALYAPIKKVRYNVEATRVGQMTDLDRLVIEVETDGSITPKEAIEQSSEILVDHFLVLSGKDSVMRKACVEGGSESENPAAKILIEEVNLSPRTTNALLNNELKTIEDILKLRDSDLRQLKGFGAKAYEEVKDKIAELGFELAGEEE